jgi:hypothetical protein
MWGVNIVLGLLGFWVFLRTTKEQPLLPEAVGRRWRTLYFWTRRRRSVGETSA